jgi:hypothetical protein
MKMNPPLLSGIAVSLLGAALFTSCSPKNSKPDQSENKIEEQHDTTLLGEYTCLPHRGAKPGDIVTQECALGLLSADSQYYALDMSAAAQPMGELQTGDHIKVSGTLSPVMAADKQVYKYEADKKLTVSSIEKIGGNVDDKTSLPDKEQTIRITSPKAGEKLIKGSTYKITWSTSPSFDSAYPQVMITLITAKGQQGVGPNQQIITKNTGSVDWTVPTAKLKGDIQSGPAKPYVTRVLNDGDEFQLLIEGYPHITGRAEGPFDYSDVFWIVRE